MEATREPQTFLDEIKPPRLEDAGLEDCALSPELIKEAFLKAASAIRSITSDDDVGRCVDDPWEDSSDALVGITEGVTAPSSGCAAEKGGGLVEAPANEVVGPGLAEGGGEACVDGSQGLGIGEKVGGILGSKGGGREADVVEDEDEDEEEMPILIEGLV